MRKNLYLLFLFLFLVLPLHAQEKKYLLMDNKYCSIYTPKENGTFLKKSYAVNYNKVETYSETLTPSPEEVEKIYKESVLLSTVKTDAPTVFRSLMNKPFTVKDKKSGKTSKFCFYGSGFLKEDLPTVNFSGHIITPPNGTPESDPSPYLFFQDEGKTFFAMDGFIYLFRKDKILQNLFPEAEVKFTDKNFASRDCQMLVRIVSKSGEADGSFYYGVETLNGIEVLPQVYEKIYIAADAILVKDKGLWYFYDFFGHKILEKGFRKILPLQIVGVTKKYSDEERQLYKRSILKYAVLDRNEIKILDNIYQGAKNSEFVSSWAMLSFCGTRSPKRMEVSSWVRMKDNTVSISKKTDLYGYGYAFIRDGYNEDKVTVDNTQAIAIDKKGYGTLSYLNKADSSFVFNGAVPQPYYFFVKSKKDNRQQLKVMNSICVDKECSVYAWNMDDFPSDGMELSYDNIEDFKSEVPLLTLEGDYTESFHFSTAVDDMVNNNLLQDSYYKLYDKGKVGLFSPRSERLRNIKVKYKKLEDLKNRFSRFEDENGKKGWLSEDNEEFYDL